MLIVNGLGNIVGKEMEEFKEMSRENFILLMISPANLEKAF
jgi:hypothetical protein